MEKKSVEMDSYTPCDALAHKLSIIILYPFENRGFWAIRISKP